MDNKPGGFMDVPKLVRLNNPILHRRARLVPPEDINAGWFQSELNAMIEAMRLYRGVGLAAPQIGINRQVFTVEVSKNTRYPDAPDIPLQIYINPETKDLSKQEVEREEGCLSVPALRAVVPRVDSLTLKALDRYGNPVSVKAEGFLARVIQHECDHLEGRIFLERVRDHSSAVRVKRT